MIHQTMLLTIGVLTLAGFVQGLSGFGFGLVAMGLLPSFLELDEAQAVVTLAGMTTLAATTCLTMRHICWSNVGHMWLGSALGVPLGFGMASALPREPLLRLLGLTICLLALSEIMAGRSVRPRVPTWGGWCVGLASGTLSGAFNVGGPPLVAYIYGRPWPKERQVATLSGVFLASGSIRLVLMLVVKHLPATTWTSAAWAIGPMVAATICGNALLKHISQRRLRLGVALSLLAIGSRYLVTGS
jgi:uncharacterized membrane protein YfcA